MAGFLYRGILLQQHKEPALSRDLREFFNADTIGIQMNRPQVEDPNRLSADEICEIAREAKIVDERDGTPLIDKILRARVRKLRLLVGDAIDDEPYISSQLNPLLKNQEVAFCGLALLQKAVNAPQACFAVYRNLTDLEIRIPKTIGSYKVRRIHGRYPAEYQASRFYGSERGVLEVGVGAIIHLARAVLFNRPQTTTFVTVAGDCIGNPTNLEVSLGMTVTQTLERCGLIDDPVRVVIGGSMTGISVIDTDKTLINPSTRAILAFRARIGESDFNCIGCSRCVHACPEGLNPFFLYRSFHQRRYEEFRKADPQMCIGCGSCSYVCPAKLDLTGSILRGQAEMRRMIGSIRLTKALEQKKKDAEYRSYYQDYLLYQEGKAQKKDLRQLEKARLSNERAVKAELQEAEKQAAANLEAANNAAQAALEQALKASADQFKLAEETVQVTIEAARSVQTQTGQQLEQVQLNAQRAQEAAQKARERALQADARVSALEMEVKQKAAAQQDLEKMLPTIKQAVSRSESDARRAQEAKSALSGDSSGQTLHSAKAAAKQASEGAKFAAKNLSDAEKAAEKAAAETAKANERLAAARLDAEQQHRNAQALQAAAQDAVKAIDGAAAQVSGQERTVEYTGQVCAEKLREAQQVREKADADAQERFRLESESAKAVYDAAMKAAADAWQTASEEIAAQYQATRTFLAQRLAQAQADAAAAREAAERAAADWGSPDRRPDHDPVNVGEETQ